MNTLKLIISILYSENNFCNITNNTKLAFPYIKTVLMHLKHLHIDFCLSYRSIKILVTFYV